MRTKEGAIASVIQEAVTGIRAVKIFGREDDELERFRTESEDSLRAAWTPRSSRPSSGILLGLVGGVGTALVLYFAALQVLSGALSVGQLTVFIAYLGLFLSPYGPSAGDEPDRQVARLGGEDHRAPRRGTLREGSSRRPSSSPLRGPRDLRGRSLRLRGRGQRRSSRAWTSTSRLGAASRSWA